MPKYMMDLSVLVAQVREVAVEVGAFLREQREAFDRSAWCTRCVATSAIGLIRVGEPT